MWKGAPTLRPLALLVFLVGSAIGLAWWFRPPMEYLPKGNQNLVFAIVLPPPGYNLPAMRRIGDQIDARTRPYWDVDPGSRAAAALPFPAIRNFFFVAFGRQIFMGASAWDPLEARRLVGLLNRSVQGIPGTYAFAQQASLFERGLTASRSIDIEIRGPDLRRLVAIGGRIFQQVRTLFPGAQARPIPSLDLGSPEVHILPRWTQAADMGVTGLDLGYTVNAFVDGAYAGDYFTGGDKIDLTIMGDARYASHLQDLKDLPIATPSGNLVPLGAVADIVLSSGPEQINRRERERAITIQMEPPPGLAMETAVERVRREIVAPLRKDGTLGGAYRIEIGGTADKLRATLERLGTSLLLALAITYLLMAALFESFLYPFIVILSVPLGAVGGVLGLWILNLVQDQPLDTLTMIGFVILIGTVVNNAILIVHQALTAMREEGIEPAAAVRESLRIRVRPIFMTLFTTIFGLAPLVVLPGAGSELYRGIGSILIGGLVVSTFLTLLLVPIFFRLTVRGRPAR
ncbi:MAG: efflux RND transporter permease subunit, partial [Planctomycetota bacterium]